MPLYDHACESCGEKFEAKAPMDVRTVPCPCCGAEARRVFSPPRGENSTIIPERFRNGIPRSEVD